MIHHEIPKDSVKITIAIGQATSERVVHGFATLTLYAKPQTCTNNVVRSALALLDLDFIDDKFDYAIGINNLTLPYIMWDSPATLTATLEVLKEGET